MKKDASFHSREDDFISSRTDSPLSLISVPAVFEYIDEPISLLSYNQVSRGFSVNPEAIEFLKSLGSPVAVISVAGLYRTGKSYLLNRVLLNRKSGFGVGPTINPCTKGIWLWGRPINGSLSDGSPCSVVVVDTEGLGALDQDNDYDSKIFSLSLLLSSAFIYNSVGTIDEDAIQKLSLVVNLTKHIQLKSKVSEEAGAEDYAPYFPKFVWVLRDFTLKLVDQDGESITPKEYLEIALKTQKGYSDMAEEKNRVRRLLKEFFLDRECFMMVRPVKGEESLQNLEEKEFEELRYEFVEQVLDLRKKMLNGVKPKMLNGKVLTGEMLATLMETYVASMNKGAMPSIESAWSYICKNECSRALQDAQEVYEKYVMNTVTVKFPMHEDDLAMLHKEAKHSAMELFKSKAVGDEVAAVGEKLKNIISEKFLTIKAENEAESEKKCSLFLSNSYSTIDQKLRNNEYKSFIDFEKDIKKLQRFFKERGPEGPFREEILLEFCQKKILDTADYFLKESQSELSFQEDTFNEKQKLLESNLKDLKDEMTKERADWQRRLTSAESERTEFSAKENSLREQLLSLRAEKEKNELELRNSVKSIRTELGGQVEAANSKAWEYEEKMKEIERLSIQKDSEFQEKTALMEQKVKYLESSLEESRRKEKEYLNDSRAQKKDHSSTLKDIQSRFENQIKNLQSRLESETDRVTELEKDLEEKERQYEHDKLLWEELEVKFKASLQEKTEQLNELTEESKRKAKEQSKQEKKDKKDNEANTQKLSKKVEELEKKLKSQEDNYKKEILRLTQENAIAQQKLEFSEQYLQESKAQLEEERKQHSNMLMSIHGSSGLSNDDLETQLDKLRQQYSDEIRNLEEKSDQVKRELSKQIESLTQKNTELELEFKCQTSDLSHKLSEAQTSLSEVTEERNRIKDSLADFKAKLEASYAETESKQKKKIAMLEREIDSEKTKHTEEVKILNERSETSYAQLKEYYEAEKKRLENRLQDEKERAEKKFNLMTEEFEDKLRRETEEFDEEMLAKDEEMRELDAYYNDEINSLKHQAGLDLQKIESLEKYLKENKEQIEALTKAHALALEQAQERMNSERVSLVEKIEKFANELAVKDRETTAIIYKKEQIESQLAHKEAELEDLKAQYEKDKVALSERAESFKVQLTTVSDELIQKKNDFKREMALAQQEIEFKNRKIGDLERSLHDTEEKYNEALKSLRDESGQELSATIQKLTIDKESLEQKLEQRKKDLKELSTNSNKQIGVLEKEKAVLSEKLTYTENKINDIEQRFKQEIELLNQKLKEKKDAESNDKMSVHIENERLKTMLQEMEKEIAERNSASERERLLWDNKHNFLMQQRDSAKADLSEAQKKFDMTLEQIQKKGLMEKEKLEANTNTLITSIETRYTNQIKDLQENLQSQISTLTLKNKSQEKELRSLKEELELERRGRSMNSGNTEKKIQELQETELRLLSEIELIKKDREKRIEELQDSLIYEKEQLKVKISDLEKRAKEAEHLKGMMYIEHEKEKAKWNSERDHIVSQKNEAIESLERAEKKKETLLRENEKLRVERGKNRNPAAGFLRRGEATAQQEKVAVGKFFSGAGISFEDFAREKNEEEQSGRDINTISPGVGRRGTTPLNFKDRKRSGLNLDKLDSSNNN